MNLIWLLLRADWLNVVIAVFTGFLSGERERGLGVPFGVASPGGEGNMAK